MRFSRILFLYVIYTWSVSTSAKPALVNFDSFQEGNSWVWSYSEKDAVSGLWQAPYLFETYKVVNRSGSIVTIDMSSDASSLEASYAHHRFIVDLQECFKSRDSLRQLLNWKIEFYTKTRSQDWQLVSRRHKNVAFTEKFNCYEGNISFKETRAFFIGDFFNIAKWLTIPLNSFYISDGSSLEGVAAQRRAKNYLMQLDSVDLN